MSKVKRFSLEERYGYQNRKVIYDKNSDNDIELNNIYPIIDLFNQLDEQISDLQHKLKVAHKALKLAVEIFCSGSHPDMKLEIKNMAFISGVVEYLTEQAEKELKE